MDTLSQLPLPSGPSAVLAAVGSGGKTSCLTALARRYRAAGRSVLLTTTTHMRRTEEVCCSPSLPALERRLKETGLLFAGSPAPEGKISPLPPEQYAALALLAQVTLVEADGSRGLPLKLPARWEPVLPPKPDLVLVLQGLSGLGKPLAQVCHRWELAREALGCDETTVVTPELAARLLEAGYLRPLEAAGLPYTVLLNQADTADPASVQALQAALAPRKALALSLRQELNALSIFL